MAGIAESLRHELAGIDNGDFAEGYAESFLNTYVATQIKTIRQQRGMTQGELARALDTSQTVISRIENVNYAGWNIGTLRKLARAFELRLQVSFEEYGTLPEQIERFSKEALERAKRTEDPRLSGAKLKLVRLPDDTRGRLGAQMFEPIAALRVEFPESLRNWVAETSTIDAILAKTLKDAVPDIQMPERNETGISGAVTSIPSGAVMVNTEHTGPKVGAARKDLVGSRECGSGTLLAAAAKRVPPGRARHGSRNHSRRNNETIHRRAGQR